MVQHTAGRSLTNGGRLTRYVLMVLLLALGPRTLGQEVQQAAAHLGPMEEHEPEESGLNWQKREPTPAKRPGSGKDPNTEPRPADAAPDRRAPRRTSDKETERSGGSMHEREPAPATASTVRAQSWPGTLIRNPNRAEGGPEYAVVDRLGLKKRYIRTQPDVDLDQFVDREVTVLSDTGLILDFNQLELGGGAPPRDRVADAPRSVPKKREHRHVDEQVQTADYDEPTPAYRPSEPNIRTRNAALPDPQPPLPASERIAQHIEQLPLTTATGQPLIMGDQVVVPQLASQFGRQLTSTLRLRAYGEFLFIQPSDGATTSFAVPISGPVPPPTPPVPLGPVATVDPEYEPGFRVGFDFRPHQYSAWGASLTHFESDSSAAISVDPAGPTVLHSLVIHPTTSTVSTVFLDATATGGLDYQLVDLDYRGFLDDCDARTLNYVFGGRYVQLDQDFSSRFLNVTTVEGVDTNIDFDGAGIRGGFEGEWHSPRCGGFAYGRGFASFVAGEFSSSFRQTNTSVVIASAAYADDRVVPMLDFEVGVGWQSRSRRWRISGGYVVSAWYNVVSTPQFIEAVHAVAFDDVSDTLTFDGLVARAEVRF